MKNLYKLLFLAIALVASQSLWAETRIDLGELQLDTEYSLSSFKNYIGTFTAPRSGVVTCSATTNDVMYPYHEVLDDMNATGNEYAVTYNNLYGGRSYDFNVEEGQTYVMYARFIMNSNTVFKMTMAETQSINLTATSPDLDGTFNVSNGGQISFDFDKAVTISSATIGVGATSTKVSGNLATNSVYFNVKELVWNWLTTGVANPGDSLTVTMTGVRMVANSNVLYNGDGILKARFLIGPMPITLVSTVNTDGPFLSYYTPADSSGIVQLIFSGKVAEGVSAQLKYGDIDKDPDGDYYVENLPCVVDGNTITVNLQGKRRRPSDMISSGTTYPTMSLGIMGVHDTIGNYAYAPSQGSLGSYWYGLDYQEVTANVVCEFTPASGSLLDDVDNLEIWIADEEKLTYDGVEFAYEKNGENDTLLVSDFTKTIDPDDETARILSVPVPAQLTDARNVVVSLHNLMCADGTDYSPMIRAKYNSFIISRTTPVASSTMEYLKEGTPLKVFTNMDSKAARLEVVLRDLNPGDIDQNQEVDNDTIFTAVLLKQDGKFIYILPRNYRLERGHDYRLEVNAYSEADVALGEDFVLYHGAADPFRYSNMKLESITPDTTANLSHSDQLEFVANYDGLVKLDAADNYMLLPDGGQVSFAQIEPINTDADGYATSWRLVANAVGETPTLTLRLVAFDIDGYRVEGNHDWADYTETLLTYVTDYVDAISAVAADNKPLTVYDLQGRRYGSANTRVGKDVYILGGRKILQK